MGQRQTRSRRLPELLPTGLFSLGNRRSAVNEEQEKMRGKGISLNLFLLKYS